MFDTQTEFHVNVRIADGGKTDFVLRWPSDQEWSERARLRKNLVKNNGRGGTETISEEDPAYELKLFDLIKVGGTASLTSKEATYIINLLAACNIMGCELGADDAKVKLRVYGGDVTHTINQPTAEQMIEFSRSAGRSRNLPYNVSDVRIMLEPGGKLWDACKGHSEDYPHGVPILHKEAAIRAVIAEIDRQLQPGENETDFS